MWSILNQGSNTSMYGWEIRQTMCRILIQPSAFTIVLLDAVVSVEFESGSYVVDENEGMVEVCLVKIGETTRSISVDITARQSSPVDAVGMLLLH